MAKALIVVFIGIESVVDYLFRELDVETFSILLMWGIAVFRGRIDRFSQSASSL